MKQEDNKDLLFKDLSARLPYGVKLKIKIYEDINEVDGIGTLYQLNKRSVWVLEDENERCLEYNKPYLFPLSSMTEEQREEFLNIQSEERKILFDALVKYRYEKEDNIPIIPSQKHIDWLNKNHFDYRGLIPMGLANDATGLNIY